MFNNRKMGSSDSLLDTIKGIMEKKHTTPETPKEKALAKLAHPKDKITHKDVLVGRGVLKKENSGDRMGVIVGTRKEKVEIEPKLKEGKIDELKQSTVKSYTDKANKQMKKIGKKMMNSPDDYDGLDDKEQNTLRKRQAGFDMTFRKDIRASQKTTKEEVENVDERKLTGAETEKKEKYVLSMKKKMGGFKQRYGERAKEVMYATATKMAKEEAAPVNELEKKKYVDLMRKASDPSYGSGNTDRIAKRAEKEHGAKFAKQLQGVPDSHFPRRGHSLGSDALKRASSPRITKAGKINKQDVEPKKAEIKMRLGRHKKPNLPEGK